MEPSRKFMDEILSEAILLRHGAHRCWRHVDKERMPVQVRRGGIGCLDLPQGIEVEVVADVSACVPRLTHAVTFAD